MTHKRKTNFRWFKKKGSRNLTVKAKKHLSKKLIEFWKEKKKGIHFYRYTKLTLWTDESFYTGLEIKTHIFTKNKLKDAKEIINKLHKEAKKTYDVFNWFTNEEEFLDRRRIAFEESKISKPEFSKEIYDKFSIITRIVLITSETEPEGKTTTTILPQ